MSWKYWRLRSSDLTIIKVKFQFGTSPFDVISVVSRRVKLKRYESGAINSLIVAYMIPCISAV